ncbi:MAG TPA: hypothetical protein VMZ25_08110 [Terriglobales bacterium]|nr:hypothetical protein [Terriglobales bacterium]
MRSPAKSLIKAVVLGLASLSGVPLTAVQSTDACPQATTEPVVENLIRSNLARARALPAYQSTRTYRVDYRGFPGSRSAEMIVDVKFEPPGNKVFVVRSQTGSKLIIDRVFKKLLESEKEASDAENQKRNALNHENYDFKLLNCESWPAGLMYVLEVAPKTKSKYLYRGKIWVDARDFAVYRISAEPAKNPSFWIKQTQIEQVYAKVRDFWLPASNRSSTSVRLGGHADFSIEYKDYQLTASSPIVTGVETSPVQAGSPHPRK